MGTYCGNVQARLFPAKRVKILNVPSSSSELDPNDGVKFYAPLTSVPPREHRFQKVNSHSMLEHGFPKVESLAVLKELTFSNIYCVKTSICYIQGMRCLESLKTNGNKKKFSWGDFNKDIVSLPQNQAAFLWSKKMSQRVGGILMEQSPLHHRSYQHPCS